MADSCTLLLDTKERTSFVAVRLTLAVVNVKPTHCVMSNELCECTASCVPGMQSGPSFCSTRGWSQLLKTASLAVRASLALFVLVRYVLSIMNLLTVHVLYRYKPLLRQAYLLQSIRKYQQRAASSRVFSERTVGTLMTLKSSIAPWKPLSSILVCRGSIVRAREH
jgi:hypothetical protein